MEGTVGRPLKFIIDGRAAGTIAYEERYPNQFLQIGARALAAGRHTLVIQRGGGSLHPGSGDDVDPDTRGLGPIVLLPRGSQTTGCEGLRPQPRNVSAPRPWAMNGWRSCGQEPPAPEVYAAAGSPPRLIQNELPISPGASAPVAAMRGPCSRPRAWTAHSTSKLELKARNACSRYCSAQYSA